MSELEKKTLAELKEIGAEMGLKSISGLKKSELIEKIEEKQLSMEQNERPTETASDFSQTKTDEIPQETTEREKQFYEETGEGILEVLPDGYGFLRAENCLPGINDVYVSPAQIRRFNLRTGDRVKGIIRPPREGEKVGGLIYVQTVNGDAPYLASRRPHFEELTPIYPEEKLKLETEKQELSGRIIDLIAPIGKGQRGMIVAPPKVG
ncbi:MAG: Rho termination factor N-terminal domain-containing protein, partial [Anaerotignum sp.]|nr:Rho termination factor N-terminal domain-containing protein [Anaerotignum sp.]